MLNTIIKIDKKQQNTTKYNHKTILKNMACKKLKIKFQKTLDFWYFL